MDGERYYEYMLRRYKEETKLDKAKRTIWVTFKKEGIHKYPAALDDPKLATGDEYDVSFLGYPHRHIFHFKVQIEVFHDVINYLSVHKPAIISMIASFLELSTSNSGAVNSYAKMFDTVLSTEIIVDNLSHND